MPGYLVWLNARLLEMKRLLKRTGSIYVHLDWHAVHYVKVEMDKIFGCGRGANNRTEPGFRNEIVWCYSGGGTPSGEFPRKHDTILWYTKSTDWTFNTVYRPYSEGTIQRGRTQVKGKYFDQGLREEGTPVNDWWADVKKVTSPTDKEKIGYPTQKSEDLLDRIITVSSNEGDVVADFFCGGGTTPAVAQRLNRRWIACDQSRIAVALTADRVARVVEDKIGSIFPVPDFTVEHWGIYEIPQLEALTEGAFREFVVKAFGGRPESVSPAIHGVRHGVPLYVGQPSRASRITKDDVARFAKAIFEERRANAGTMLAWNFGPDAKKAAEILAARENKRIDFVRLSLVRLEADEFRDHVIIKSKDYGELLSFIQPPLVRVAVRRLGPLKYEFDVSESVSLNKDGIIANVQWDFAYDGKFTSTQGYSFLRDKHTGRPLLVVEYTFPKASTFTVACSVQDDQGGERTEIKEVEVR